MGSETFRKTRGIFIFVKDLVVKLVKIVAFYLIMNNDKELTLIYRKENETIRNVGLS